MSISLVLQKVSSKASFILLALTFLRYGRGVFGLLTITEVYIDGTDEWIEITNIDTQPFIGSFSLQGAKSTLLNYSGISLAAGESYILGDQCTMLTDPLLCYLNQGLSLTDTKSLTFTLSSTTLEGVNLQNTTILSQDLVNSVNDKKTSLSCLLPDCLTYFVTEQTQSRNTLPEYIANPGVVLSPSINTPVPEITLTQPPQIFLTASGNILLLTLTTTDVSCEQSCTLTLTGQETYSFLVQVNSGQTRTTGITMTGTGQQGETFIYSLYAIDRQLLSGQYEAVFSFDGENPEGQSGQTSSTTGVDDNLGTTLSGANDPQEEIDNNPPLFPTPPQDIPHISISEIHPTDDFFPEYIELLIPGNIQGTLTIIGAGNGNTAKSIPLATSTIQRLLITAEYITGVDYQYVLPSLSLTDAGEELSLLRQGGQQIDKAVYTDAKKGFSYYIFIGSGLDNNFTRFGTPTPGISEELFNLLFVPPPKETPSCEIHLQHTTPLYAHNKVNFQAVYIHKALTSTSPYICQWSLSGSIFTGCNPSFVAVSQPGVYTLQLTLFSLTNTLVCTTTTQINLPDLPKTESCRAEYYSGLYTNRKEKYSILSSAMRGFGFRISGSGTNITLTSPNETHTKESLITGNVLTGNIYITQLIPNPIGEDKGNEWIEIVVLSGNYPSGSLLLTNGTRALSFPPHDIQSPTMYGFTGNWGLLNKSACMSLVGSGIIYDSYCYTTPKEGIVPPRRESNTTNLPTPSPKGITILFTGDQACVKYQGQIVHCKDLLITKIALKELKKTAKQSTSLQKKLTSALTWRDKYKKVSLQFTSYKKQHKQTITEIKQKYTHAKDTLYTLKSYLYDTREIVVQDTYIKTLYTLFAFIDTHDQQKVFYYQKDILSTNISETQALSQGTIQYDDKVIPSVLDYLAPFIQSYINKATPDFQNQPP